MNKRTFRCLDCGEHTDSFLQACPECGSTQYEAATESTTEDVATGIEKLTRPVNPLVSG